MVAAHICQRKRNRTKASLYATRAEQVKHTGATDVRKAGLHPEQLAVLAAVMDGNNVFFTGLPGSGKSYLMEKLVKKMRENLKTEPGSVAVCASTGAAAVHVGGTTLHAFLGCGPGDQKGWAIMRRSKKIRKRIQAVRVLLVDEISMISGDFMDEASAAMSELREDTRAFGGVQVVLCGDFLQLTPVGEDTMAFESEVWRRLDLMTFQLQVNHRQADDAKFQSVLRDLRFGRIHPSLRGLVVKSTGLNSRAGESLTTRLYSTNQEANLENSRMLALLPGKVHSFRAQDWAEDGIDSCIRSALRALVVQEDVDLKVGAVVVLLKNLSLGGPQPLVNGSLGEVIGFGVEGFPIVKFDGSYERLMRPADFEGTLGDRTFVRTQVPLKLAWALTVHKSQGMTLTRGEVDLKNAFEFAQAYVALSRFRHLDSVRLLSLPRRTNFDSAMRSRAMGFHSKLACGEGDLIARTVAAPP